MTMPKVASVPALEQREDGRRQTGGAAGVASGAQAVWAGHRSRSMKGPEAGHSRTPAAYSR